MTQKPKYCNHLINKELAILFLLIGGFVVLNLLTATWFPQPWRDEVAYADPAIRFVLGKGFTSAAWSSQGTGEFWASNCPLHEILLIPWLKLFGIKVVAVRALNVLLCATSIVFLWAATRRNNWIIGAGWRLFMCLMLLTGYGMFYVVRCGRPDGITVFVAAALAFQFARTQNHQGQSTWSWGPFLTAMAAPWAGLQLVVGVGALCAFSVIFDRPKTWRYSAGVAGGIAVGFVLLLLFFAIHGQAMAFIERTIGSGHTVTGQIAQYAVIHDGLARSNFAAYLRRSLPIFRAWTVDPSYMCIIISILACTVWCSLRGGFKAASFLGFGLIAGMGTPVIVMLAGKYPPYYAWMGLSLVTICAVAVVSRLWATLNWGMKFVIITPLFAACIVGAPRLFGEAWLGRIVRYEEIEQLIRANVVKSDRAFVEGAAYFATTDFIAETYAVEYGGGRGFKELPPQQRDGVTVLILAPSSLGVALRKLGGKWKAGARILVPATPFDEAVELVVYRRESAEIRR